MYYYSVPQMSPKQDNSKSQGGSEALTMSMLWKAVTGEMDTRGWNPRLPFRLVQRLVQSYITNAAKLPTV